MGVVETQQNKNRGSSILPTLLDPPVSFPFQKTDGDELTDGAKPDIGRGSKDEGEERLGPVWFIITIGDIHKYFLVSSLDHHNRWSQI